MPGGDSFLYLAIVRNADRNQGANAVLRYAQVDGSEQKDILSCNNSAVYASGRILFVHDDGLLMARPFDSLSGEFTGPALPILDKVMAIPPAHLSVISASANGILAYSDGEGGGGTKQLFSLDLEAGKETPLGQPQITFGFSLSHDERRMVLSLPDMNAGTFDLWVRDLERDLETPLSFDPESEMNGVWSPDDQWLAYSWSPGGVQGVYRRRVDGGGEAQLVFDDGQNCTPTDWSGDGRTLALALDDSAGLTHIGVYDLEAGSFRLLHPKVNHFETGGRFSPDGKWLCYTSFETGKLEVFVESLDGNGRYRVSRGGGSFASWGPAGRQIFYLDPRGFIMATDVVSPAEGSLQFGEVREIARGVEFGIYPPFTVGSRTGRIILERSVRSSGNTNLQLVTSWPQLLEDRR